MTFDYGKMPIKNIKTYSKKGQVNNLKFNSLNINKKFNKKNICKSNVYNTRSKNVIDISLEPRTSVYVTNLTSDESIRAPWAETTFDRLKRNSCDKIKSSSKKPHEKLLKKKNKNKSYELSIQDATGNTKEGEGIGDHQLIIEKEKKCNPANSFHLELTQCTARPEFAWNISKSQSSDQINESLTKRKNNVFSSTFTEKAQSYTDISYYFKNASAHASTPYKKSNNNLSSLLSVSPIPSTSNSIFEKSVKKIPSILEESTNDVICLSTKKSRQDFSSDLFSTDNSYDLVNDSLNFRCRKQMKSRNAERVNKSNTFYNDENAICQKSYQKKEKMLNIDRSIKYSKLVNSDATNSLENNKSFITKNSEINKIQSKNLCSASFNKQKIPIVLVEKLSDHEVMKYLNNVKSYTSISEHESLKNTKLSNQKKSVRNQNKKSKEILDLNTPILIPKDTPEYLNCSKIKLDVYSNQVPALILTPISTSKYLNQTESTSPIFGNVLTKKSNDISNTCLSSLSMNGKEFNNVNNSDYIQNQSRKCVSNLNQEIEILHDSSASYLNDCHSSKDDSLFELSLNEDVVKLYNNSDIIKQSVIDISDEDYSLHCKTTLVQNISESVINSKSENINNDLLYINMIKRTTSSKNESLKCMKAKSETSLSEISKTTVVDNKSGTIINIHNSQNKENNSLSINMNKQIIDTLAYNSSQTNDLVSQEKKSFGYLQSNVDIKEFNKIPRTCINYDRNSEQLFQKINHSKLNEFQSNNDIHNCLQSKNSIILKPGKKWRRSLAILRSPKLKEQNKKGKKWLENIIEIMRMQPRYSKYKSSSFETLTQNVDDKNVRRHSEFLYPRLSKRYSVRIVQEETNEKDDKKTSDLKFYASCINDVMNKKVNTDISYESKASRSVKQFHDLYDITNSLNELILSSSSSPSQKEDREFVSAKKIVLQRCEQDAPLRFEDIYSDSVLKKCHKIGEGVYGEVYLLKEPNGSAKVLKVIPIEGNIVVNGEPQKKFNEVLSEIIISQELSGLRQGFYNQTSCFIEVKHIKCVQGFYPNRLTELWELYDEDRGSENDHPSIFLEDQLYIVFELAHGGQDLEGFKFLNAEQSYSVFLQAVFALAVAECELNFEHRDLHWGNLLVSYTTEREIVFNIKGEEFRVRSNGVKAVVIDFTLSRCTFDGCCIYNDLSEDQDLFTSDGDYQFEVYRLMQKKNGNEWGRFEPYTNILWLHYIILKMIDGARYTREVSKKHKSHIDMMRNVEPSILTFTSAELLAKSGVLKQL